MLERGEKLREGVMYPAALIILALQALHKDITFATTMDAPDPAYVIPVFERGTAYRASG